MPGFGAFTVSKFSFGQSNPTFLLKATGGGGGVGGAGAGVRCSRLVVRMKPKGAAIPGAHAVEREFRVLSALHAVAFPVPRVRASPLQRFYVWNLSQCTTGCHAHYEAPACTLPVEI